MKSKRVVNKRLYFLLILLCPFFLMAASIEMIEVPPKPTMPIGTKLYVFKIDSPPKERPLQLYVGNLSGYLSPVEVCVHHGYLCESAKQTLIYPIINSHPGEPWFCFLKSSKGVCSNTNMVVPKEILFETDSEHEFNIILGNQELTKFIILGAGFEPGENVQASADWGFGKYKQAIPADEQGQVRFPVTVEDGRGKSGRLIIRMKGQKGEPSFEFPWGLNYPEWAKELP